MVASHVSILLLLSLVPTIVLLLSTMRRRAVGVVPPRGCALLVHRPRGSHRLAGRVLLTPVGRWALAVVGAGGAAIALWLVVPTLATGMVVAVVVTVSASIAVALTVGLYAAQV